MLGLRQSIVFDCLTVRTGQVCGSSQPKQQLHEVTWGYMGVTMGGRQGGGRGSDC